MICSACCVWGMYTDGSEGFGEPSDTTTTTTTTLRILRTHLLMDRPPSPPHTPPTPHLRLSGLRSVKHTTPQTNRRRPSPTHRRVHIGGEVDGSHARDAELPGVHPPGGAEETEACFFPSQSIEMEGWNVRIEGASTIRSFATDRASNQLTN